jgi:hypothetical protein
MRGGQSLPDAYVPWRSIPWPPRRVPILDARIFLIRQQLDEFAANLVELSDPSDAPRRPAGVTSIYEPNKNWFE